MLARAVGWLDHRQAVVTSRNKHRITLFILGYGVADEVGNGSRDPHSVVAKGEFCRHQGQRMNVATEARSLKKQIEAGENGERE